MKDTPQRARELALTRLALSGLDARDLLKLRLEPLTAAQTAKLHPAYQHAPALKIPYLTTAGQPHPHRFYRLRYLETEPGFAAQIRKPQRYTQPPDSWVFAYFPPNHAWPKTLADPTAPITFTEGELKAAAACKLGFTTIGLGGVYSWRSVKLGLPFLSELEAISWAKRPVFLAFDSDASSNPMVTAALRALGDQLVQRGADVFQCTLPDVYADGRKTGLDDLLVEQGPDGLQAVLDDAEELALCRELWRFNEEVVYVTDPGLVVVQATAQKLGPPAFKDHAYADRRYQERYQTADGALKFRDVALPKAWLEWPHRFKVARIAFEPGRERIYQGTYNTWQGWQVAPKKGDAAPWRWLLNHLFGKDEASRRWFEAWCAYPLQYPGAKLFTAALLWGRVHGSGKSQAFMSLSRIYGEAFGLIDQSHLDSQFNDWAYEKQLVLVDDLDSHNREERNHRGGVLRTMISRSSIRINQKFVPGFKLRDCVNYGLTANQPDAVDLDDDDRRMFVHEVLAKRLTEEQAIDYDLWSSSTVGAAALFYHLLHVDATWFNPHAPALETAAKRAMINDGRGDVAGWLSRLKEDPDGCLRIGRVALRKDLYTNSDVKALIDPAGALRLTSNLLGRELRRAGFLQVCGGDALKVPGRAADRYYALRRSDVWLAARPAQCSAHVLSHDQGKGGKT